MDYPQSYLPVVNLFDEMTLVQATPIGPRLTALRMVIRGPVGYVLDEETRRKVDRLFELFLAAVNNPGEMTY